MLLVLRGFGKLFVATSDLAGDRSIEGGGKSSGGGFVMGISSRHPKNSKTVVVGG
jgi:hypothetical protein